MVVDKNKLTNLISQLAPEMVANAKTNNRVNLAKLFELVADDYLKLLNQIDGAPRSVDKNQDENLSEDLENLEIDGSTSLTNGPIKRHEGAHSEEMTGNNDSRFDPLTQLPNRRFFAQTVDLAIKRAERHKKSFALIFIDIDHFKAFNDTHGHLVGDALLKELSQRVLTTIRKTDTLCRLSGDEFCLLVEELEQTNAILQIIESIKEHIILPFEIGDLSLTVTTSMGISIYPDDGKNYTDLLHFADLAMYQAKRSGRNTVSIFTPEISAQVRRLNQQQKQLKSAINSHLFDFSYQPELELSTGNISGARQIASIASPGLDSEVGIYHTAQRSKHLCRLNIEIIEQACQIANHWRYKFNSIPRISIPLYNDLLASPQSTRVITEALEKHQLNGDLLEFEINESDFNQQSSNDYVALKKIFELGCCISLVNVGISPTALHLMSSGFIHKIKMDKVLVSRLDIDKQSYDMMDSMIKLCDKFSIHTVALDVTSLNQIKRLEQLNCGSIRGDFLSPSLVSSDYEKVLSNYAAQQTQHLNSWKQQRESISRAIPTNSN